MGNPVVQIQARLGSTRLPGKVLYHLDSRRVIEWVVRRSRDADRPNSVVLAIGDRSENAAIGEWCERTDLDYLCGPEENLLERHLSAAKEFDSDPIVRITGDCPFVPSAEIDRLLEEHSLGEYDYTTNATDSMPVGTAVDIIDRSTLEELSRQGADHPVLKLRNEPEEWDVSFTENEQWLQFSEAHTAVDTPDDYWNLVDAMDAVGTEPADVARWIANELKEEGER